MNEKALEHIDMYLRLFSRFRDTYKNQCSEISLKVSALNMTVSNIRFSYEDFKKVLGSMDFTNNLEHKLITSVLYLCNFQNYEEKLETLDKLYSSHSDILKEKTLYTFICGLMLLSDEQSYSERLDKFIQLYKKIEVSHPLLNAFEYSPFILIAALSPKSIDELSERSNEIYYSMHDSKFARGTNSYCTSLYLSTFDKKIDTDRIRDIYVNLKSLLPVNQFNYISCAQLYALDEGFENYALIGDFYKSISKAAEIKWFSEQLDLAIATALYLDSIDFNPLKHLNTGVENNLGSGLLTTMISSTLLLNNELD